MVQNKNIAAVRIDVLEAFDMDANSADRQQEFCPGARDAYLHSSSCIEERNNQADRAKEYRGQNDRGVSEQRAAQPFHARLFYETGYSLPSDSARASPTTNSDPVKKTIAFCGAVRAISIASAIVCVNVAFG